MTRPLLWILLLLCISPPGGGEAQQRPLRVGVREAAPFAIREPDGSWRGISVELWDAVARSLGVGYELREVAELPALLAAVEAGELDVAVGALTITAERETALDFSHPFFATGLSIAVPAEVRSGWLRVLRSFLSPDFLRVVVVLGLLLLVVGALVWLFERRRNPEQFGGPPLRGIGAGFWWSAVTMTTVGYGDKAPLSLGGRLVALVWMFAGLIIISSFTAAITSTLTVGALTGPVQGPEDLDRARVGTVTGSTSAAYLETRRVRFADFPTPAAALEALRGGRLDAVVYDAPILQYLTLSGEGEGIRILGDQFDRQFYGIALAPESALREPVNRALLARLDASEWQRVLFRYLGE